MFQQRSSVVVAGLDLSLTNSGVAILTPDGYQLFSFGQKLGVDATQREHLERNIYITNSIIKVLQDYKVKHVGLENYAFSKATNRISMQAELGGMIKSEIYSKLKTIPVSIPVNRIRKFVLGKSTSDKKIVLNFLRDDGFSRIKNLDQSDALAVALVVDFWINRRAETNSLYHQEVLDELDRSICST